MSALPAHCRQTMCPGDVARLPAELFDSSLAVPIPMNRNRLQFPLGTLWARRPIAIADRTSAGEVADVVTSDLTHLYREVPARESTSRLSANPGQAVSGGRDRRRSGDLTLFRSEMTQFRISVVTGYFDRKAWSPGESGPPAAVRWITLIDPVSRSYGHFMGTKLDQSQVSSGLACGRFHRGRSSG